MIKLMNNHIKEKVIYIQTPDHWSKSSMVPILQSVDQKLAIILKDNPNEQINLYGFSRGGIFALAYAHKLNNVDKKAVNFLGIIDPVPSGMPNIEVQTIYGMNYEPGDRRLGELNCLKAKIPSNVANAFFAWSDRQGKQTLKQAIAVIVLIGVEKTNIKTIFNEMMYKDFNHFQVGTSDVVLKDFLKYMKDASVPLN